MDKNLPEHWHLANQKKGDNPNTCNQATLKKEAAKTLEI